MFNNLNGVLWFSLLNYNSANLSLMPASNPLTVSLTRILVSHFIPRTWKKQLNNFHLISIKKSQFHINILVPFIYAAATTFQTKYSSYMFYKKNRIYCSWLRFLLHLRHRQLTQNSCSWISYSRTNYKFHWRFEFHFFLCF